MTALEAVTLWLHIAAGIVALVAGFGALATTKGGQRHRRAGRVYVAAMGVVVATVFPLVALDPTTLRVFLALVAVFSGYLAFSGYRALARKRPAARPATVDWAATSLAAVACLGLGGWGLARLAGGDSFGIVLVAFGSIGLALGVADVRTFRSGGSRRQWLASHLGRMVGAYIATVTAVAVVNVTVQPRFVGWLWPTAVGVPLIWYWQGKYADTGPFVRLTSD